jgi:hypothetical protein
MLAAAGTSGKELPVAEYQFERESRTPFSEAYTIEDQGDVIGRVDVHFTASGIVYATLCIPNQLDDDDLQDLIAEVDERLVLTTDPYRDDFQVTVWRGTNAGVYSEELEDEDEPDDGGNGRPSGPRLM